MQDPESGYEVVSAPASGFWRVTNWPNPFDPPPPAPLGVAADEETAGRWDAPDGSFRTLYCATDPEGALGEKIAPYALNPPAVSRIEAFFEGDPDPEFADDHLETRLSPEDIEGFAWTLAHARATPHAQLIDVWHWRTLRTARRGVLPMPRTYGFKLLDLHALVTDQRPVTRALAGHLHATISNPDDGARLPGLRYTSRLPPQWECWALWEPLPLDPAPESVEDVTAKTPALRRAATKLGVVID